MSLKHTSWEFTAYTTEELAKVRQSLPKDANAKVKEELFPMARLLESLACTNLPEYPFKAHHTREKVPDFQLESGSRRIGVEMAQVTMTYLEKARSLQAMIPNPPSHYAITHLCYPESFAKKLNAGRDAWSRFTESRMPEECRAWLSTWCPEAKVPERMKELLIAGLNSIIDGPQIEGDPALAGASPTAEVIKVEGFPCEETPRHWKAWLDEAFREKLATPINPTLIISSFIRQNDSRMDRKEVLKTGFFVHPLGFSGPTLEEENNIWIEKVFSEVQDKTTKLSDSKFCHGDEDWLVLWDRLSSADWQLAGRAEAISQGLKPIWNPNWFSCVFIQDQYFKWQWMFTPYSSVILPSPGGVDPKNDR